MAVFGEINGFLVTSLSQGMVYQTHEFGRTVGPLNRSLPGSGDLEVHFDDFSTWLEGLGRSPGTIRAYRSYLRSHFDRLKRQSLPPGQFWLRWQATPQSRRMTGLSLRIFGKFLSEFGLLPASFFVPRSLPSASKPKPRPADFRAILAILAASRRVLPKASGRSFRGWILLIWETGLRRSEAANVTWDDLILDGNPSVSVLGKGGNLRSVPFSKRLAGALDTLRDREGKSPWIGARGQVLGGHDLARMFRNSAATAKISGVKLHHLRHARLTLLAAVPGIDPITWAAISGHRDLRFAAYYVRPDSRKLRNVLEASRARISPQSHE